MLPEVIAIVGPTAVGKSDLGLWLARELGGEIVNADALQVYRGLDIGTAKPTPEERQLVAHHLIDILDPDQRFSAGEFARRAREVIAEVRARGRRPILVGGSGFYYHALFHGLAPIPVPDEETRARLRARLEREGLPSLLAELGEHDPLTASRLPPGDTQRILRALEVWTATGRPLSAWIADPAPLTEPLSALSIGLTLPRSILYHRIADRTVRMFQQGWVAEVRNLLDAGVSPEAIAFQAIGYREIVRHLATGWSLEEAQEETIRATRRFAKRQSTWFAREEEISWFQAKEQKSLRQEIASFLRNHRVGRAVDA
ncbi:MAG TPA: tRNA (adenosine(37)-N6)-dimethylallyltransferase MiaA [Thermoanaerobaculia bacterium]|nr:tRNA (adenosine(37)-N6)-dimethylallyltransferase MiaA [Thermoanaerobaculia bacterium]